MRVIAGCAKRIQLKTIDGMETRPTTDRIKETLFNMINPLLYDCDFLDVFSGSGAIGIEALSRGAKSASFIEKNPLAVKCIKENLARTKLLDKGGIYNQDVVAGLRTLELNKKVFDIVFMDPPYNQDLEKDVLVYLAKSNMIYHNTSIIVEASLDTDFSYLDEVGLVLEKEKKYKTNKHVFISKR